MEPYYTARQIIKLIDGHARLIDGTLVKCDDSAQIGMYHVLRSDGQVRFVNQDDIEDLERIFE
jgi:hypothetical protein